MKVLFVGLDKFFVAQKLSIVESHTKTTIVGWTAAYDIDRIAASVQAVERPDVIIFTGHPILVDHKHDAKTHIKNLLSQVIDRGIGLKQTMVAASTDDDFNRLLVEAGCGVDLTAGSITAWLIEEIHRRKALSVLAR